VILIVIAVVRLIVILIAILMVIGMVITNEHYTRTISIWSFVRFDNLL